MGAARKRKQRAFVGDAFVLPGDVHAALPEVLRNGLSIIRPPPDMTVSEFADAHRVLSAETAGEQGRYSTDRAAYQRGMMNAVLDPAIETVALMTSSQVGKTKVLENVVGYFIKQDPCPILWVCPKKELAETTSKDNFDPMVQDNAWLRDCMRKGHRDETITHKKFAGGHITFVGSNVPADLAQRPIRLLVEDEIDRFSTSAGVEGSPRALARKRQTAFPNRKEVVASTPTLKGFSTIERLFESGDQRRWYVPCPDCNERQVLQWSKQTVVWEKDDQGRHDPESATYVCVYCGSAWSEAMRRKAIRNGEWRATVEHPADVTVASFHVSELSSPLVRLADTVRGFLAAKNNREQLKTWWNTTLGESWAEEATVIDPTGFLERLEEYPPTPALPDGVVLITAGADVHPDRIELEVVGWGAFEESWSLAYEVFAGDIDLRHVWNDLDEYLREPWVYGETGVEDYMRAVAIDSSFASETVYRFTKPRSRRNTPDGRYQYVASVQGMRGRGTVWPERGSKRESMRGRIKARMYSIKVDPAKDEVFSKLRVAEPGPNYCHFPLDRDIGYFEQLTAERIVVTYQRGFPVRTWEKKTAGDRNEAFDARVYAYAALQWLYSMGLDLEAEVASHQQRRLRALQAMGVVSSPPREPAVLRSGQDSSSDAASVERTAQDPIGRRRVVRSSSVQGSRRR